MKRSEFLVSLGALMVAPFLPRSNTSGKGEVSNIGHMKSDAPITGEIAGLQNCDISFVDGGIVIKRHYKKQPLWFRNNTIYGVMRGTRSGERVGLFGDVQKADRWYAKNAHL